MYALAMRWPSWRDCASGGRIKNFLCFETVCCFRRDLHLGRRQTSTVQVVTSRLTRPCVLAGRLLSFPVNFCVQHSLPVIKQCTDATCTHAHALSPWRAPRRSAGSRRWDCLPPEMRLKRSMLQTALFELRQSAIDYPRGQASWDSRQLLTEIYTSSSPSIWATKSHLSRSPRP